MLFWLLAQFLRGSVTYMHHAGSKPTLSTLSAVWVTAHHDLVPEAAHDVCQQAQEQVVLGSEHPVVLQEANNKNTAKVKAGTIVFWLLGPCTLFRHRGASGFQGVILQQQSMAQHSAAVHSYPIRLTVLMTPCSATAKTKDSPKSSQQHS
jgi:hypothetical protein